MKVVFAGPSIYGMKPDLDGIQLKPPAVFGDMAKAVLAGAKVVGLVDGMFETKATTWHKEILWTLHQGVQVFGGASMGALRAAECRAFGMTPVGTIAERYCSGELIDDGDVALSFGPAELDYVPITEALVDFKATIENLRELDIVDAAEAKTLLQCAQQTFFKLRTIEHVSELSLSPTRKREFVEAYREHHVSLKGADAVQTIGAVSVADESVGDVPTAWSFNNSPMWRAAFSDLHKQ